MNWQKRSLARRSTLSFPAIEELISQHEVVLLPIVDGLLCWRLRDEAGLFDWLERQHQADGFAQARIKAEWLARRRSGTGGDAHVSLPQIHEVLSELMPEGKITVEIEQEAAGRFLLPDPAMRTLLETARTAGRRVVGLNVHPLPLAYLDDLLKQGGLELDGLHEPQASSDRASFLASIAPMEQVEPVAMLHVGSSETTETEAAISAGMTALSMRSRSEDLQDHPPSFAVPVEGPAAAFIAGKLALNTPLSEAEETPIYQLGYLLGGPILLGFCLDLMQRLGNGGDGSVAVSAQAARLVKQGLEIMGAKQATLSRLVIADGIGGGHSGDGPAGFLIDWSEMDDTSAILLQGSEILDFLFSVTPQMAGIASARRAAGKLDAQGGTLDFLRHASADLAELDADAFRTTNRAALMRLLMAPSEAERSALATVPTSQTGTLADCVEPRQVAANTALPPDTELLRLNQTLRDLLPRDLVRLAESGALAGLDWRQELRKNPFKIGRWATLRRYQRRLEDRLRNRLNGGA
ncbi:hypothetical protein [Aliiruegeria sabulilitoris]|uniref:hypothetical protein n=1 Tax=Aliiruegeria sabulilitoris TaxID=1510458 RepID=UPI000831C152|nr:hypothetical protein [Aliiruegeria sabulilitoris]NDR55566.1 hypothetical protein [Pseudoruegeria sp. M32A2M]